MKIKCDLKKNDIGICATKKAGNKKVVLGKEFDGYHYYWYVKVNGKEVRSDEDPFLNKNEAIKDFEDRIK